MFILETLVMISCHCQGVLVWWRHADDSESTWFNYSGFKMKVYLLFDFDSARTESWLPLTRIWTRGFEPLRLWNPLLFPWLWFEPRDSNPCVSGTHSSPDYDSNPGIWTQFPVNYKVGNLYDLDGDLDVPDDNLCKLKGNFYVCSVWQSVWSREQST